MDLETPLTTKSTNNHQFLHGRNPIHDSVAKDLGFEMDWAVCFEHSREESYTEGLDYKACGECWHVWPTEADFKADVWATALEIWGDDKDVIEAIMDRPIERNYTCPLCAHDF